MKKVLVSGPVLSRSGYGEMARLALRALKPFEDQIDLYVNPISWGATGWLFEETEEKKWIDGLIYKNSTYAQNSNGNPQYDISIQVTIPNEWKKIAKYNIGYTAGIETNFISPAWFAPSMEMDKIIVISEHAKKSFLDTVFQDQNGNMHKVMKHIDVVHFPVRDFETTEIDLNLDYDFNFLAVCQWGPRKNLEQTIMNFIEEFKNEEVGLVIKTNISNDSLLDKEACEKRLQITLAEFKNLKCKIYLLHGHMSESEISALYKHAKIKAIVSTTHGEGYGLPLFEAAYNELPVIATDWSGHLDFLTGKDKNNEVKKLFAKVDYELKPIAKEYAWPGVLEEGTSWAYPLANSFKNKMREVIRDYPRFKSWAKQLNKSIRENFTAEKVHGNFINVIFENDLVKVDTNKLPKISIITSVYNGDEYIKGFLEDITSQTIFKDKAELILVNCNSPQSEEAIIKEYQEKYPENIKYIKLDNDPGIYAAWNIAIKEATGEFITNANLDDRKSPNFLEELAKHLMVDPEVEVVYADNLLTKEPNETWQNNTANSLYPSEHFSEEAMLRGNSPHCMPMWRKSLHERFGYFEENYRSASDWEMWLRCTFGGVKMKKLNKTLGLYYFNPKGMSTNQENNSWKKKEEKEVFQKYLKVFQDRLSKTV
jgi:glycosyltransferase involved in cell wall biosynthesis